MGDLGGCSYPADGTITSEERNWAMAAHLSTLLGSAVPFGNFLAPLVIWLVHREKSAFVDKHARESLVFQVGIALAALGLVLLAIVSFGAALILVVPAVIALFVADLVYMVLATMRANEGKIWEYPFTTRFVS